MIGAALPILVLYAAPASAQATRTWVSGVGDDVNPCSRTAPCKTFAGAISKTAAGGEIDCLDPGGFGTLTITKSITVDCTGTFGSVLNSGGINGFVINDSATGTPNTIDVILRGLSIDGAGTTPGLNGIRFISGRSLFLQDVFIQNQNSGSGISFQPGGTAELHANNVSITDGNNGILIQPTGASGVAKVVLQNVRAENNAGMGISVNTTGNTAVGGVTVTVDGGSYSGNGTGISFVAPGGTTSAAMMLLNAAVSNNSVVGLTSSGPGASVRVGNTTVTGNTQGVSVLAGSTIASYGNNRNIGNPTVGAANNGAFSFTTPTQ
ncbi:hypothetical protein Q9Q95_17155 [Sphingomonas sp. DG1-23]|uniref:hypothetical protein n=1 Tax=Sphingomonas sp. DG1-23 TaxID=3068316 RepID=UPI00274024E0|nr:hypothetical protein [Sphingomonas sp. DG1-23]MDP5280657.1 hypothetical protein [Sphingomonas sp. DG1-23]